jgi:glycosyltransferase involved in cell wall biosynthesis
MSSQPLVSVCIPSYNSEEFIATTLESVLGQKFVDFEIVIADDKSTDRTISIVKGFNDPRIRLIENEQNLGLGPNWNRVLSCARGQYVKLLGDDDLLYPECLARQVRALEHPANANAVLAICNRNVINARNEVVMRRKIPFGPGLVSGRKLIRNSIRWGSNLIGEPVVGLFRRRELNQTVMCDPSNPYLADLALWADLLKHGDAFVDPDYLAGFRISRKKTSARIGRRQAAYFRDFVRAMHRDSFYHISLFDMVPGYILSSQWCVLRNLFIYCRSAC